MAGVTADAVAQDLAAYVQVLHFYRILADRQKEKVPIFLRRNLSYRDDSQDPRHLEREATHKVRVDLGTGDLGSQHRSASLLVVLICIYHQPSGAYIPLYATVAAVLPGQHNVQLHFDIPLQLPPGSSLETLECVVMHQGVRRAVERLQFGLRKNGKDGHFGVKRVTCAMSPRRMFSCIVTTKDVKFGCFPVADGLGAPREGTLRLNRTQLTLCSTLGFPAFLATSDVSMPPQDLRAAFQIVPVLRLGPAAAWGGRARDAMIRGPGGGDGASNAGLPTPGIGAHGGGGAGATGTADSRAYFLDSQGRLLTQLPLHDWSCPLSGCQVTCRGAEALEQHLKASHEYMTVRRDALGSGRLQRHEFWFRLPERPLRLAGGRAPVDPGDADLLRSRKRGAKDGSDGTSGSSSGSGSADDSVTAVELRRDGGAAAHVGGVEHRIVQRARLDTQQHQPGPAHSAQDEPEVIVINSDSDDDGTAVAQPPGTAQRGIGGRLPAAPIAGGRAGPGASLQPSESGVGHRNASATGDEVIRPGPSTRQGKAPAKSGQSAAAAASSDASWGAADDSASERGGRLAAAPSSSLAGVKPGGAGVAGGPAALPPRCDKQKQSQVVSAAAQKAPATRPEKAQLGKSAGTTRHPRSTAKEHMGRPRFYHSRTCTAITEVELQTGVDSDGETDSEEWEASMRHVLKMEPGLNVEEQEMALEWNRWLREHALHRDADVAAACRAFYLAHPDLHADSGRRRAYVAHLLMLWQYRLLTPESFRAVLAAPTAEVAQQASAAAWTGPAKPRNAA